MVVGAALCAVAQGAHAASDKAETHCAELVKAPDLMITSAQIMPADGQTPAYCHAKGFIRPGIRYHMQLPLPEDWNGRFLHWGDGAKDGDLDFADHRVAEGYAVANSNMGHDSGSEPGASFAFNNRQSEIDFGYRAVHLTVNAAKSLIERYYGNAPAYSYHEGCSTGGRQGLMEAQRFPSDFDGIVAGAPVSFYQEVNGYMVWVSQKLFADNFAGNLAHDKDGDGVQESLTKRDILASAVMEKCDGVDGIEDGVISRPLQCDFNPRTDLKSHLCAEGTDSDDCFTPREVQTIEAIYEGPGSDGGAWKFPGMAPGSELAWPFIPHAGNNMLPFPTSRDHFNYLFYEEDPGIPPADIGDTSQDLRKDAVIPEWAWWEFDTDELATDAGDFMRRITNATDPNMDRFLNKRDGKLLLYHGWADGNLTPEPLIDYYQDVVQATFDGDMTAAQKSARLFLVPGMYHCGGGPGLSEWDRLDPLVEWVEDDQAPDRIIGRHRTEGKVDNERPICPYPQNAVYTGPEGEGDDPANWVAENFSCQ